MASNTDISGVLKVGDLFDTFAAVEIAIEKYEKDHFINLCIYDSMRIEAAARYIPKITEKANQEIVYYFILLYLA